MEKEKDHKDLRIATRSDSRYKYGGKGAMAATFKISMRINERIKNKICICLLIGKEFE